MLSITISRPDADVTMPAKSTKTKKAAEQTRERELEEWRDDASRLSYEESLQAADLLLSHLQNDGVPIAELERAHRRGQIYLERCSTLLDQVEQSVQELDPDTMTVQTGEDDTKTD